MWHNEELTQITAAHLEGWQGRREERTECRVDVGYSTPLLLSSVLSLTVAAKLRIEYLQFAVLFNTVKGKPCSF